MPKEVSEITSGVAFSRSSESNQISDSQQRIFKVILNSPTELFDIQQECGVYIGDELRPGAGIYCNSFDARYEGDSRMAIVCTFQFRSTPGAQSSGGGDPKAIPPDIRPANWSIGSSLYEIPLRTFFGKRTGVETWGGPEPLRNPANDMYDGVTAFDALVTISISQFEPIDPTRHARHVGAINENSLRLGSLLMEPHTVMLRGISSQPAVESWGGLTYRGWNCSYEFAYKANDTNIHLGANGSGGLVTVALGWDIALPQTGFNVKAFTPPGDAGVDNIFGQPLAHHMGKVVKGNFDADGKFTPDPTGEYRIPFNTTAGDKVRGMVKVYDYEEGGTSLLPCAQPIPLNDNGRPRAEGLDPLVYGYQVHRAINFQEKIGLRLY